MVRTASKVGRRQWGHQKGASGWPGARKAEDKGAGLMLPLNLTGQDASWIGIFNKVQGREGLRVFSSKTKSLTGGKNRS